MKRFIIGLITLCIVVIICVYTMFKKDDNTNERELLFGNTE